LTYDIEAGGELIMSSNATLYDTDFHDWANEQAALPRAGRERFTSTTP